MCRKREHQTISASSTLDSSYNGRLNKVQFGCHRKLDGLKFLHKHFLTLILDLTCTHSCTQKLFVWFGFPKLTTLSLSDICLLPHSCSRSRQLSLAPVFLIADVDSDHCTVHVVAFVQCTEVHCSALYCRMKQSSLVQCGSVVYGIRQCSACHC